ncbi:uncharacterized protein LOC124665242 [Lolium rigidum]|uniref:uncharacterized protein LOC124665242 n=1 Tax=Lolium rigidum TaxID=89674 RepID=UPI001F5DCFF6|nr:uncharacterized protein LOC124665242 [Lolium rigidum]
MLMPRAPAVLLLGTPWPPTPQPMCAANVSGDLLRIITRRRTLWQLEEAVRSSLMLMARVPAVLPLGLGTMWPPMPQPWGGGNGYTISGDLLSFPFTCSTCSLEFLAAARPEYGACLVGE